MASDGELISLMSSTLGSINQVVKKVSLLYQEPSSGQRDDIKIQKVILERKALIFDEIQRICEGYIGAINRITRQNLYKLEEEHLNKKE